MNCKILLYACLLTAALAISSLPALAQGIKVSGKIVAKNTGQPLDGATVAVKGTPDATLTDAKGNFKIVAPNQNSTLANHYFERNPQC